MVFILLLLKRGFSPKENFTTQLITFMGRESLVIYLAHVVPIVVVNKLLAFLSIKNIMVYWVLHLSAISVQVAIFWIYKTIIRELKIIKEYNLC